jgi:hypothetical protein
MMRYSALITITAAMLVSSPVVAKTGTSAGDKPTEATASADQQKKVCKKLGTTGSRMAKDRVCMTKEEWKKVEDEARL